MFTADALTGRIEKVEEAIDLDWERHKLQVWTDLLAFKPMPGGFEMYRRNGGRQPGEWPRVSVNEAISDPAKMLLQQLGPVYDVACRRTWSIPNIRCNYGTGILPSLFGTETFWMEDSLDTLPTNTPMGTAGIDRLLDAGMPDLDAGFGKQVFQTAAYYKEMLAPYPNLREAVWLYHPDLQGPIDVVELLWGSDLFYAFYDQPEKVKAITELVTQTYIRFLRRWFDLVPERDPNRMVHWGRMWRGHVMLRDDSIVNLSPEMYDEFVKPYDERVMATFGGGAIHMCGHVDHCIERMTDSKWLWAVNPSQPHLNDMRRIHAATVGKGLLLDLPKSRHMDGLDVARGVVYSAISNK